MTRTTSTENLLQAMPFIPGDGLVNRVSRYLEEHPEISREEFLRDALEREIEILEHRSDVPAAVATPEEIRDHAWIEQGLNRVRHQHRGFGDRLRGMLFRS